MFVLQTGSAQKQTVKYILSIYRVKKNQQKKQKQHKKQQHSNITKAAMCQAKKEKRSVQCPAAGRLTCRLFRVRLQDVGVADAKHGRLSPPSTHCGL